MQDFERNRDEVNARILYWGIRGSGKTTNLQTVYAKLRPDHRGELREIPTRLDPSVFYEVLPIELGEIAGFQTQIRIVAPPGGSDQAPTRKQLLDQVDGIVLVVDAQSDRIHENVASLRELREALEAYGRNLDDIPLVIQYNKRDLADPFVLEELHRALQLGDAPVFETIATDATGVLQTLSTISKKVVRALRETDEPKPELSSPPAPPILDAAEIGLDSEVGAEPKQVPSLPADATRNLEESLIDEPNHPEADSIEETATAAENLLDTSWERIAHEFETSDTRTLGELSIVSVGEANRASERSVRIPLVLGDPDGRTTSVVLTLQIDPLVGDDKP
ncbi:GTPase domain-containing protein [Myxococcota bacterium]|nr:GTPase domain-containing protein [Myxococcota bacterium]